MSEPLFPEIEVDVRPYADKPMACMAMVRRALQRAGQPEEAARFTREVMAADPDSVLAVAGKYVHVP